MTTATTEPHTQTDVQRSALALGTCSGLSRAMLRAVELIQKHGKIEADWRNGFNSCGRWMEKEAYFNAPDIRMVTLDALRKHGVLRVEEEYSYHGHGEWLDHQVYLLCPNVSDQPRGPKEDGA